MAQLLHGPFMKIIGSALVAIPTIKLVFVMQQAEKRRQRLKSGVSYEMASSPPQATSDPAAATQRAILQTECSYFSIADDAYTMQPISGCGATTTNNVTQVRPSSSTVSFNIQSPQTNYSPPHSSLPQSPVRSIPNQSPITQSIALPISGGGSCAPNSTQLHPPLSTHVLRHTNSQTQMFPQSQNDPVDSTASKVAATAAPDTIALPIRELQHSSASVTSLHTLSIPRPSQLQFVSVSLTPSNGAAVGGGGHSSRLGSAVSGIGINFRRSGAEDTSCCPTPSQLPTPSEELISCHSFTTACGTRAESLSVATLSSRPACVKYKQKNNQKAAVQQKKTARRHDQHNRTTLMLLVVRYPLFHSLFQCK